jgi:hypothetical protein
MNIYLEIVNMANFMYILSQFKNLTNEEFWLFHLLYPQARALSTFIPGEA